MEAIQTKKENTFKNKVIFFLIGMLALSGISNAYFIIGLVNKYSEHAYFVSEQNSYIGQLRPGYRVGEVEIRTHLRAFYGTMFSYTADSYETNIKFAEDNLCDYESAKYIEDVLSKSEMHNSLYRSGAQLTTVLEKIDPVDFSQEPYRVKAYCKQYLVKGDEKSEMDFVNTMEVFASGIQRTDNNPQGLKIKNWKNVVVETK